MASGIVEQVPRYTMSHTDDGIRERLQLTVSLPGVTSAQEFEVRIQTDKFILRSPGRYNLVLPLHAPVEAKAESLQFVKKKQLLKAELKVVPTDASAVDSAAATQDDFSAEGQDHTAKNATPAANKSSKDSKQSKAAGLARNSKTAQSRAGTHVPAAQHRDSAADQNESDSSLPGEDSNSDTSPTFSSSPGVFSSSRRNDDASSDHSERASSSAECSCSDGSSSSAQIWQRTHNHGRAPAKTDSAHDMRHSAPPQHQPGNETEVFDDAEEIDAAGLADWLTDLHDAGLNAEEAFLTLKLLTRASEALQRQHWQKAADLLLDAQLQDSATAACLGPLIDNMDPDFALAVQTNVGSAFAKMVAERMSPQALAAGSARAGSAKSMQQAREQAEILKLLQGLRHPTAQIFQDPKPATSNPSQRTASTGQNRAAAADARAKPQPQNHQPARRGKKRAAASNPSYPGTGSSPVGSQQSDPQQLPKQQQQQQQQQQSQTQWHHQKQGLYGGDFVSRQQKQWDAHQAAASYGPEQQAEAKRQAKKEAALAWLDKAKAAAAAKNWTVALERAQKALSLNPAAEFAQEVHALMSFYKLSQQKADANSSHSSNSPAQDSQTEQQRQHQPKPAPAAASATQRSNDAPAENDDSKAESTTYGQYGYTYADGHRTSTSAAESPWMPEDDDSDFHDADDIDGADDVDDLEQSPGMLKQCCTAVVEALQSWSDWLQRKSAPVWRHGRQVLLNLLKAVLFGSALVLTACLFLCDVLPALLYLTGRQKWRKQLQRGKEASAWWARALLFIASPGLGLLMLYGSYRFIAGGHILWVVKAAALGAALPFRKTWGAIKFIASLFDFGWANLPIIVSSRFLFNSWWPAMLSSSLAVWHVMGRGWLGVLCGITSAVLTFFLTYETISVPTAMIVAYLAITKSFITGSMLKGAFLIAVGVIWWIWQDSFRRIVLEQGPQKRSRQSTAPQNNAEGPLARRVIEPMSSARGSTDSKSEIQRILSTFCHYTVLEVDTAAEEEVIRRAKRTKSLLVHPDKVGDLAGASDAFGKVTDAAEVLCDPYKRRQYDAEQAAAAYASQTSSSRRSKPEEEDDPNVSWQRCTCCGELHRCIRTDKTAQDGRWCKECHCYHPVKLGQGWVTKTGFMSIFGGREFVVYACLPPDGAIYDVTESSECQGMLQCQAFRMLGPDCCKVWLTFGSPDQRKDTGQRRQRQRYEPPNEAAAGRKNKRNRGRKRR